MIQEYDYSMRNDLFVLPNNTTYVSTVKKEEFFNRLESMGEEITRAIGNSCVGHVREQLLLEEQRNKMLIAKRKNNVLAAVRANHWVDDIVNYMQLGSSIIATIQLYCANYSSFLQKLTQSSTVNLPIIGAKNLIMMGLGQFVFGIGINFITEAVLKQEGMGMMTLGMKLLGQLVQTMKYAGYHVGKGLGGGSISSWFAEDQAPDAPDQESPAPSTPQGSIGAVPKTDCRQGQD